MGVISAITFDVDGTFYNLKRAKLKAALSMFRHLRILIKFTRIREEMRMEGGFEDIRKEQAKRVALAAGKSTAEIKGIIDECIYKKFFSIAANSKTYPWVRETLKELSSMGIRLGIISDYPCEVKLKGLGLWEINWEVIINSEELGFFKPRKEPFEEAAKCFGLPPENILHVGDREDVDVKGAKASGFKSALFISHKKPYTTEADFAFHRYAQFLKLVKEV